MKRKPPVKVKKDTKAKKEECKVEKLEIPEIKIKKEPTPEATAKVKEEFSPEAVQGELLACDIWKHQGIFRAPSLCPRCEAIAPSKVSQNLPTKFHLESLF